MSKEQKKKTFSESVPAPLTRENETIKKSIVSGQDKLFDGLTQEQADITLHNMKLLAPLDKYTIGGETYDRQMLSPTQIKELRDIEKKYIDDLAKAKDGDERLELDFKLIYDKARIYLKMTKEQFNKTDFEYLKIVLEACELRTQGFRRLQ